MSYLSNADIETRLGTTTYIQLADDDGDNEADVGVVDEARLGAEREGDSYLARRYAVPIDLVAHPELTDLLATFTLDLAEYRLRARRPPIPDAATQLRQHAAQWLERIANGTVDLPALTELPSSDLRGPRIGWNSEERALSRDELSDH